ncbi:MAG: zinc ribbon domain-containing protein [Lachnospiraceae bacterium]|nr:zinc ribbon domain-containing protein [Lachnospiraceae bacterium]
MRYCPNCGKPSEDRARFCGACGFSFADTDARQAPPENGNAPRQRTGRMPLFIGIAVCAVVIAAAAAILVPRVLGGVSSADFVGSQVAFLEERANALTGNLTKDTLSSDIMFSASVDGSGDMAEMLGDVLDGTAVVLKLDGSPQQTLLNAALFLKGSSLLEGFIRVTPDEIGFCVPDADETYYTGRLADLADTLGIRQPDADTRVSAAEIRNDIGVIVKRYQDILAGQITKDRLTVEKGRDVRLSEVGKTVRCTVMTWEPDEDDITGLISAVADALETDEEIGNLLDAFFAAEYGYDSGMDMLADLADRLRDRSGGIAAGVAENGLVWRAAFDGKSQINLISVETGAGEVVFERADESGECAEAFYINSGRAEVVRIINAFSVSGSRRTGEMAADTDTGTVRVAYDIDLAEQSVFGIPYGTYTPDLRNLIPGVDLALQVTGGAGGSTDHILTVGGLKNLTGGMLGSVELVMNTTGKSTAKEPSGKTEDISGYNTEELENLLDDIGYGVSEALMNSPEMEELMKLLYGY